MRSDQKSAPIPWQGVVALVAAVTGTFFYLAPLDTSRPVERSGSSFKLDRTQDVDARLWQDPLAAAFAHETEVQALDREKNKERYQRETELHSEQTFRANIAEIRADLKKKGNIFWVMPVIIPGGSYAENAETRLRTRHAVLEGVGTNGFSPMDGEHLGYARITWPPRSPATTVTHYDSHLLRPSPATTSPDTSSSDAQGTPLIMPYEWFEPVFTAPTTTVGHTPTTVGKILVLWLRDEEFEKTPLSSLVSLLKALQIRPAESPVKVIGPRGSTGLLGIVKEALEGKLGENPLTGVTVFSATPTASESMLLHASGALTKKDTKPPESVKELLGMKAPDLGFHRVTTTDETVCRTLVEELERRGVQLKETEQEGEERQKEGKKNPPKAEAKLAHVALISEWDTFYGRALPLTFAQEASRCSLEQLLQQYPENIHPFHYLRGIDGMLPGGSVKEAPTKVGSKDEKSDRPRETTEGLNQADYLRRLAVQLQELNERLLYDGGKGLQAVGVLGSDVYDKLLVLKALRRALPGVLFFTNNLDARLGHPDEWAWTRNLIVASPFGLRLEDYHEDEKGRFELQGKVLPFRDSYQTAVYTAALMASNEKTACLLNSPILGEPRLFEIARSGPYELAGATGSKQNLTDLHPSRAEHWWNCKRMLMAEAMVIFLAGLIIWVIGFLLAKPTAQQKTTDLDHGRTEHWWSRGWETMAAMPAWWRNRAVIMGICLAGLNIWVIGFLLAKPTGQQATTEVHHGRTEHCSSWVWGAMGAVMGIILAGLIMGVIRILLDKPRGLTTEPAAATDASAVPVKIALPGDAFTLWLPGIARPVGPLKWPKRRPPTDKVEKSPLVPSWGVFTVGALIAWMFIAFLADLKWFEAEPFAWLEGISIWPTEVIRLLAIIMAVFFYFRTNRALHLNQEEIEKEFGLTLPPPKNDRWKDFARRLTLRYWVVQSSPETVDAQAIWEEYVWSGSLRRRAQRIVPLLVCYLVAAVFLFCLLGFPTVPYRGGYAKACDIGILIVAVGTSTALTFYVADATILNRRLIHYITVGDTEWPKETFPLFRERRRLALDPKTAIPPDKLLCDYLEIDLIARRTEVVSPLIYYPFVVLFLMIVSRLGIFDNWDWPVALILVMAFNGSYAAWSAFRLRNSAERARKMTLQRLSHLLIAYTAAGDDFKSEVSTIREMADAIRAEDRGAFAAISHHPILGAILLPSGGLGIWALSQYLPKFF